MNVVREINQINEKELELGASGASWHDEYKDSAYIFVGGLHFDLTEGDVITIFSQYGEVMDLHMPRDKTTGKTRGFGFLMYEDQRSTVLAVDNLNGAKVLEKTLRVDHVKDYKQPKTKDEEGEWHEAEEQSFNARPQMIQDDDAASGSSASSGPAIDPEDPMAEYLIAQRREEKALKKSKKSKSSKGKHKKDETPEERRARKERKKEKKARKPAGKSGAAKDVEQLLQSLAGGRGDRIHSRSPPRSHSTARRQTYSRSRSPVRERSVEYDRSWPAYSSRGGFDRDRRSDRYDDRERDSRSRRDYDNDRGN
ncbi:hypothetical protein PLICRDRAFT_86135 [Plicaturopsis crispa FD-325 SS-3]|nr:hypothetical protein PLICRDRAFT_86135 [Plicaturopsis crispa FD-325 SS-3]